MVSLAVLIGK